MLLMTEQEIRGGIATLSHCYAKANNKYMGTEKESKFISYSDGNILYGQAMSNQLPTFEFKWMTENQLDDWKRQS